MRADRHDGFLRLQQDGGGRRRPRGRAHDFGPLDLTVVERGAGGAWAVSDRVGTRVITTGLNIDTPACVAIAGDVVAFTQAALGAQSGNVVVERMPSGDRLETANLLRTSSAFFPAGRTAIDVCGDRITVVRTPTGGSLDLEVTIHQRSQPGAWGIAQQFVVPTAGTAAPFGSRAGLAFDRRRLALGRETATDVYSLDWSGQYALDQRIQGLGELVGFQDDTVLGVGTFALRVVDMRPGTPLRSTICPQ